MSLLTQASLVITPNGYKEGTLYSVIPSDGSGDMSVVRATTATRVNSAGLVELVPYNLVQYSQEFENAWWSKYQATITANATTAPDGTSSAESITNTLNAVASVYKTGITNFGTNTISCYFKKGTYNYVFLELGGNSYNFCSFNIATGTVEVISGFSNVTIEDAGNGWYRCYATASDTASVITVGYGTAGSPTAGDVTYIWGAQLVEGSVAKDYQKTETRLNIPRLDYSNGTCPSLLVEPQRTNLVLSSSSFVVPNWVTLGITPNTTISPSGIQDADTLDTTLQLYQAIPVSTSTVYTVSCWVKLGTATNLCLVVNNQLAWNTIGGESFDSSDGLNTTTWTRVSYTFTTPSVLALGGINYHIGQNGESGLVQSSGTVFIWGAQLEVGTYPTSYIPTTSASVTRNADVVSKTGISSLIGQTEGTMFLDVDFNNLSQLAGVDTLMTLNNGTTDNEISILLDTPSGANKTFLGYIRNAATNQAIIYAASPITATRYKVALSYKLNDVVLYINGTQIGTDTSATIPSTSALSLNSRSDNSFLNIQQEYVQASALWKTRLTNTQLAQLTTI